jgi:hypothetical protein
VGAVTAVTAGSTWRDKSWVALSVLAGLVAGVGTLAVAVAGFSLSFDAFRSVATAAHIRPELAWLLPVSVDGAMAVAAVVAVVMRHLRNETARYPWFVVALGAIISIGCNGLHSVGTRGAVLELSPEVRFAVSAIPALMLALSIHLFVMLIDLVGEVVRSRPAGSIDEPIDRGDQTPDPAADHPSDLSPDRVDRIEPEEPIGSADRDPTDRVDSNESGRPTEGRPGRGQSTRSGGRSRASRSSGRGRSDDDLRMELTRAQQMGRLAMTNPSAESIRKELRVGIEKARQLRDELTQEPVAKIPQDALPPRPEAPDA